MRADDFFRELDASGTLSDEARAELDAPYILARNVYRLRKARGMSQESLARALGVSQPRVAQIERGDGDPRLTTLVRLAAALGCDVPVLLAASHPAG